MKKRKIEFKSDLRIAMAFGYFETEIKINCSLAEASEKALAIIELLSWKSDGLGYDEITAKTSLSAFGWGERITIYFPTKKLLFISSESLNPFQFIDLGKNQNNVEKFLEIFNHGRTPIGESRFANEKKRSALDRFLSGR